MSLYRLLTRPLDEVLAERARFEGLRVVEYEILPHLNRFEPSFVEMVRCYSERVPHDIVALADGAALLYSGSDEFECAGRAARCRRGTIVPIGPVTTA